jgi:serine/threonine protein kinase
VTTQESYTNVLTMDSMLMEYRLTSVLGVGGFGITYLARDTHLEKDVAIKEYFPSGQVARSGDGSVTVTTSQAANEYQWGLDRFLKEARTLAGFSHPHIVRVNRYFAANGTGYMVMDYEEGESLKSYLQHHPSPAENVLKALIAPLLDGIEKVHATGFLHRDIKPDNIFVRKDGSPVLIDFGSARQAIGGGAAQNLTTLVSPGFAPFEQYTTGTEQGPWSDLYALGGVLYFAVTGHNPPDALTRMKNDTLADGLAEARARYSLGFIDAISWALEMNEVSRPRNVAEWRARLLDASDDSQVISLDSASPDLDSGAAQDGKTVRATPLPASAPQAKSKPVEEGDINALLDEKDRLERLVHDKFARDLTVMFTDLKGSTAMAEAQGDIAVRGMLKRYHDLVGDAIKQNGGVLVKTIGDGTLSHFETAQGALRAAVAVQRAMDQMNLSKQFKTLLLARIGMHTGECILEKNDIFGDVVNTASRFESAATPGAIFLSEDTFNALSDKAEIYCRFVSEITLKGKKEAFKAYKAFWNAAEIEKDKISPLEGQVPPKEQEGGKKLVLWAALGLALVIVLALAAYFLGGASQVEQRRSIEQSLPK